MTSTPDFSSLARKSKRRPLFRPLKMPLDSLSRRLLRQAVLRVHPDVFSGSSDAEEAASFNAESLVVRREIEGGGRFFSSFFFDLSAFHLAVSPLASSLRAITSDGSKEGIVFCRSI